MTLHKKWQERFVEHPSIQPDNLPCSRSRRRSIEITLPRPAEFAGPGRQTRRSRRTHHGKAEGRDVLDGREGRTTAARAPAKVGKLRRPFRRGQIAVLRIETEQLNVTMA